MRIILSPQASDKTTEISVNGLVVKIDGVDYDLSQIPEGGQAEAEAESPFIGIVKREEITVKYCYESEKAELKQSTDIEDYKFEVTSGEVPCPIKWKEAANV